MAKDSARNRGMVGALIDSAERVALGTLAGIGRTGGWSRALSGALIAAACSPALAGPEGAKVVSGNVQITRDGANTLIRASRNSIINYRSFDIGSGESVRFIQPDAASRVLNRITTAAPTRIDGSLTANGRVYIINPAGVIFGNGAMVNTAGLYAAGGHLSNQDFVHGVDHFTGLTGDVENRGQITSGVVGLVGRHAANLGSIVAPQGTVIMGSGQDALVGQRSGNVFVRVTGAASAGATGAATDNSGTINARGGQVIMGAGDIYAMAVRTTGSITAKTVTVQAQGQGSVTVSGEINAANQGRGKTGGGVDVLGKQISVINAQIDASGDNGGGTVHIGGDYQGKGERPHADAVYVDQASSIDVSAARAGKGGTAIVWSDQFTSFFGTAVARGGAGGDGGLIETSSHEKVDLSPARIDAGGGAGGKGGAWLIDPRNVNITTTDSHTVSSGTNPVTISPDNAGGPGTPSTVDHATIEASLNTGTSVIVTTAQTGRTDAGDITVQNSIAKTAGADASLTLIAQNNITVNAGVSISSTTGKLNLSLEANQADGGDSASGTGNVVINGSINTNGGSFSSSGVNFTSASTGTITTTGASTGTITLTHTGTATIGGAWNAGGDVSVTATGGAAIGANITANNANITFVSNASAGANNLTVSAGTGTIAFQGTLGLSTNNFTISGDEINFIGGANSVTGSGIITLQPGEDGTNIGLAGGSGTLNLSTTDLAALADGFSQIVIGRPTQASTIDTGASGATFNDPVLIRNPGNLIRLDGNIVGAGNASVTLTGNVRLAGDDIITAGQAIQINGHLDVSGSSHLDTTNGGANAAGANIGITGTIDDVTARTDTLILNAGTAGDIALGGAEGPLAALDVFTIVSAHNVSAVAIDADVITQSAGTGTSTFTGLLSAQAGGINLTGTSFVLTGGAATTGGGSFAMTNSGASTISTAALNLSGGFNQTGAGTLTLATGIVTTGDAVSFAAPVTLGAGASVDTTNAGGSAAGNNIVFNSAINATAAGVQGLTLNGGTAGDISLAAVGATTATGLLTLTGHNITLNSTVTTGGGLGVAVTNTGVLTIGGTMTLDGNLTQTGTGGTVQANASISTTGDTIGLGGPVTVGAGGLTFNSVGGTVNFGSTLALGANAFTISANTMNFFGGAGSVTGTSTITLQPGVDGTSIGVAGGSGTLQLTGTDLLALANGFSQIIIGRSTGSQAININAATFSDPVLFRSPGGGTISVLGALTGATGSNASFTLTGTSPIDVNANIVTDGQVIQINGPVVLSANALLDTTNSGATAAGANIGITGTVNALAAGAQGVTFRAGTGGDISLGGAVGGGAFLLNFAVTSAHNVNASAVTSDAISQAAGTGTTAFTGLLTAAGGSINLTGTNFTIGGGVGTTNNGTMTVANSGTLTISGAAISLDGAFAQSGTGPTSLNQGITTTGDSITFHGNVTAGAGVTSLNAGAATVSFDGNLALGANPFTISANTIAFNGPAGSVTGTNTITLQPGVDGTSIGVAGAAGTLQLSAGTFAALADGFSQIIIGRATGSQAININAVTFSDPVLFRSPGGGTISVLGTLQGAAASNASITLTGAAIDVNANIVTDGQAIQINGPVVLSANALLDTTNSGGTAAGAAIGITGTVNALAAGAQGLTMRAGTGGDITLGGAVGGSAFLLNFAVTSAHNVSVGAITADGISQSAGTGTSTFSGPLSAAGGGISLTGAAFTLTGGATTTNGGAMSVDNTGTLSMTGGAIALDGAFTQTNSGAVTIGAALTTTNDAISFAGPVTVSGSVGSLDAGTSTITIGSTLALGANNFLLSANQINFNGGANSVTGTGAITLEPGDPAVTIGLGGGAGAFTPDLTALADGFSQIIIGRSDSTADVHIGNATYADPITIRSPLGAIFIDQTVHGIDNASLTFTAASVVMAGNLVTNGNAIQINGPLTLVGALGGNIDTTNVGAFGGANVGVTGAMNGTTPGTESLVFQAGTGDITLGGNVGSVVPLNVFNVVSAHNVTGLGVAAGGVNQLAGTGTTTFTGLLNGGASGISLTGNAFTLTGGLTTSGGGGVTVNNGGLLILTGLAALDGGLAQTGAGSVDLAATVTTTGDAVSFASPVNLLGGTSIGTAGGDISFGNTLDGTFAFNLAAGAGNVTFFNNVGSSSPLGAMNVFSSGSVTVGGSLAAASANLVSTGAVVLDNVVTTPGGFSSAGGTFHSLASITTTNNNITVNHTAAVTIDGDLTAGSGAILLSSGLGGAGDLTFGGPANLSAASISLSAGNGSGTAIVDALTNTPLFHGAAGGATSPTTFVFRQDGAINGANLPVAAQFGAGLTGVAYSIESTNGTVIIDNANQVDGTALTVSGAGAGPTGVLLNVALNVQSLHSLSGATLTNNVTATTGNIQIDGPALAVGAVTLSAANGVIGFGGAVAADGSALTISAADVDFGGVVTPGGGGALTIQTADPAHNIFLGGTGTEGSGDLHLQSAELARIGAGFSLVTIGRSDMTGTIRGESAFQLASPVTLLAPSTVLTDSLETFGDAVTITGDLTIAGNVAIDTTGGGGFPAGAGVSIGGTTNADNVSNNRNFTINGGTGGAVALGGDVGTTQRLAIFSAAGGSLVVHNVSTLGAQTYSGAMTLSSTLDISAAGPINILGPLTLGNDAVMHTPGGAGDDIHIGVVNSDSTARALTLNAGPDGHVSTGALGPTSALSSLTITGAAISVGSANTTGPQSYNGPLTTFGDLTGTSIAVNNDLLLEESVTITGTTSATFGATVRSQTGEHNSLTVNSPTTVFVGNIGDVAGSELGALTIDAGGLLNIHSAVINTTGAQSFGDATTVFSDLVITSSGAGVSFGSTLNSDTTPRNLTINTGGNGATVFGAAVGNIAAFQTITTNADGSTRIGASVVTLGSQTYNDAVVLTADTLLDGVGLTFGSTVDSDGTARALTLNGHTGNVVMSGVVGGISPLASLAVTATNISLAGVTTTGAQAYTGDTTLGGALASTAAGSVDITGQLFLSADSSIATAGGASDHISVTGAINSPALAHALTINAGTGNVSLLSNVGLGTALSGLVVTGSNIVAHAVTTTGSQAYSGALTIDNNLTSTNVGSITINGALKLDADVIVATNSGGATFNGTVDSGLLTHGLTVNTGGGGVTRFVGAVGSLSQLTTLTTNADGTTRIEGGSVKTSGNQVYGDSVVLGADTTLSGATFTFQKIDSDTASTPRALTVNSSSTGTTNFQGNVGLNARLASITTNADGQTKIGAVIQTTNGMTFADAVLITGNSTLDGGSGSLFFQKAIDADSSVTDPNLTLLSTAAADADTTPFKFSTNIGSSRRLGGLTLGADRAPPVAATIVFTDSYGANGRIQAAGVNPTDSFTITTGNGGFTMGRGQKLTALGAINILTTGTAAVGDLTALTTIKVTGNRIVIKLRDAAQVIDNVFETPTDQLQTDTGVDFVAAGAIDFSTVPTVTGSGPQPTFCNDQGLADAQLVGFGFRQFTGGVTLSLFADTRVGHSGEILPLDLKSQGPSVTSIASSIAGAIPRDKETREVATPVTVGKALRDPLQEMGVATKDLTVNDMIEFMVGRSMYRDLPLKARPTVASGDYQVTVNRLSMASVEAAVASYRALVFTQAVDENGVPQTGPDGTAVMVNRTDVIRDTIGEAWDTYSSQAQEADGVGFRAYLESKEASGTKAEKDSLSYLRSAHEVLDRLDGLGLSPFEASIPKRKLLGEIRPPAMTADQFQAAVAGAKLSMR